MENFRPDVSEFQQSVIGNVYEGFEDENWLDIRQIDLLAPVMLARLDMIREKGFDGIEPDNINGYQNETGFNLTQNDAKIYCEWLIEQAHSRGLSIGQKNAEELVPELVDSFDWMLAESAYKYDFFEDLIPYVEAGKAVFMVEYRTEVSEEEFENEVCPLAQELQFFTILKYSNLDQQALRCE